MKYLNVALLYLILIPLLLLVARLPFVQRLRRRLGRWVGRAEEPLVWSVLFVVALLSNIAIGKVAGLPLPQVPDEFSYLFAADTFAHGRLTNPTPPHPEHYATLHVLVEPSYMAKYPPGQAVFLAIGQRLTGVPIYGVWLCMAFATAALYDVLRARLSRRWALVGTLLFFTAPLIRFWSQWYMGGGVALLGGALFLGGLLRWKEGRLSPLRALATGKGVGLLLLSRPFEGVLFILLTTAAVWLTQKRPKLPQGWAWALLPIVFFVGFQLAVNQAVTGQWSKMPYQVYAKQFDATALFLGLPAPPEHTYGNPHLTNHYAMERSVFLRASQIPMDFLRHCVDSAKAHLAFVRESPLLSVAVLAAVGMLLRKRKNRLGALAAALGIYVVLLLAETFYWAHYSAAAVTLWALLLAAGLRWAAGRHGRALLVALWVAVPLQYALDIASYRRQLATQYAAPTINRDAVAQKLCGDAPCVFFVRYAPDFAATNPEWVYNAADREKARHIWVNDLGDVANKALLADYPGRKAFLIERRNNEPPQALLMSPGVAGQ